MLSLALGLFATAGAVQAADEGESITAEDLAQLRDLDGLSVSPDGRWAAFQVRQADPEADRYDQSWTIVSTQGGEARRLADGGEPIQPTYLGRVNGVILAPAPAWSPDSNWIAYLRREGARTQIWRVRRQGGRAEQLTRNEFDVRALAYSADGRRLLFETEPSAEQIAIALEQEGRAGFVYDSRFFPVYSAIPVMPSDVAFGAGTASLHSASQASAHRIWAYEFASRRERPASEAEAAEFAALTTAPKPEGREGLRGEVVASPAGGLAWSEARDPEQQGGMAPVTIVAQPAGADEPIVCNVAECTGQRIKGVWWHGNELVFARGEGVRYQDTALYAWRPGEASARLILRTPDLFDSYGSKCEPAQARLICFYEQPNRPRRLAAIDLQSSAVETLFDPNPDFVRFNLGPPPERIEFRSQSGVENYGYLVLPPGHRPNERLPLVIVTYRCSGFLRGGTGDEYPIYPMAAQGMAVLCFNAPDTDYQRLTRMDWASYQNWSRGPGDPEKRRVQEGLETAIAQLDAMGVVDPDRVGVTGLSFGAETVSYALFNSPHLAAAIASGVGFEPSNTFLYGPAGRELLRAWGLGSPESERWDALALSRNAARVRAPLLLNVADHEMISALHPVTALQDAGSAVEMYVFPNEYHIKWRPTHRLVVYRRNVDWMNFWLRGIEDPDRGKSSQYERWRSLRERVGALGK